MHAFAVVKFYFAVGAMCFSVRSFSCVLFYCEGIDMCDKVDFEKAFSDFLDSRSYDDADNAMFQLSRDSFEAGWKAACGQSVESDAVLRLIPRNSDTIHKNPR